MNTPDQSKSPGFQFFHYDLVDNSFNLHEAERVHAETADDDNHRVQSFFNSLKNYPLTTDFILKTMNGIQDNQLIFARNHETHIQAIEELGQGVRTLTDLLKRLDIGLKNCRGSSPFPRVRFVNANDEMHL